MSDTLYLTSQTACNHNLFKNGIPLDNYTIRTPASGVFVTINKGPYILASKRSNHVNAATVRSSTMTEEALEPVRCRETFRKRIAHPFFFLSPLCKLQEFFFAVRRRPASQRRKSFAHTSGASWVKLRNDQKSSSELFFQCGRSSLVRRFADFQKKHMPNSQI